MSDALASVYLSRRGGLLSLGRQGKTGHLSTLQNRPFFSERDRGRVSFTARCLPTANPCGPSCAAPWPALQHVRVMQQAIEECGDGCGISEELAPIIHGTI